ncbi:Transcriptional regulator, TetR family [Acidisarcina polymorpha]|uniref:Transcriptional regulator, TetR family n=1 Tax=Acidisarcina polymorpha TaxID=2211140 RepID=A0A2Z5FZJ4_9BACT|nr:TetR/AcrR family transcriptional regulator [Acidisarcina polymorpha]AXC11954.1 Transcriptional regulator, TetR family [Acidisarcina polymorpha]
MQKTNVEAQPRGRPRTFTRETAILNAARLFWRHGYSGTSTRALTAALGLSTSSLYAAFGSKAGLFELAVRTYAERYHSIYQESVAQKDIRDVVESLLIRSVHEFTQPSENHPGCIISSAVMTNSAETLDTQVYIKELQDLDEQMLLARFRKAHREGQIRSGASAPALTKLIQCVWQGLSASANRGADRETLLSTARLAVELVCLRLRSPRRD